MLTQLDWVMNRIYLWNRKVKNPVWMLKTYPEKLINNEINMISEEYKELVDAQKAWDTVETLDALLDIIFVLWWTLHKFWRINNNTSLHFEQAKWILDAHPDNTMLPDGINDIYKGIMKQTIMQEHIRYVINMCFFLATEITSIPLDALEEVCRSNETKLPFTKNKNGKIQKSKSFEKPILKQFIKD